MDTGNRAKRHDVSDVDELTPRRISQRRVPLNISLPMALVNVIDAIADSEGMASLTLIERLIRKGLEIERAERATKANN